MTSRKHIKIFDFNGMNVAKHWYVAGEVFAISDCLVLSCIQHYIHVHVCTVVHVNLHDICFQPKAQ